MCITGTDYYRQNSLGCLTCYEQGRLILGNVVGFLGGVSCNYGEKSEMPAVTLRGLTILPDMIIHFDLSRSKSILAIEEAMLGNQRLFVVTQKDPNEKEPDLSGLYSVGTIVMVKQVTKLPNQMIRILVEGISRAKLQSIQDEEGFMTAVVTLIEDDCGSFDAAQTEAMLRTVKETFTKYTMCFPKIGGTISSQVEECISLRRLIDLIAINIPLSFQKKQVAYPWLIKDNSISD